MKTKIKALTSFAHGSLDAHAGQTYEINKADAAELAPLGFVEVLSEAADTKMAPETKNKMEAAPTNKAVTLTNTKTKAK